MADAKISELTELAATPAADDELAIVDTGAGETKRISTLNLFGDLATDAELATHEADTTLVHGIADTALLLTTVAHAATTGQTANDHHAQAHTVASHSDTTGTGAELNTLTGGGNADALHTHAGVGGHAMLSVTHTDSLAAVVSRGSVIVANATPAWAEVTIGAAGRIFTSDGVDATWQPPAAVTHAATTGQTANDHHNESHTVVSHSDTTATGAELNTLVGGGATALHSHAVAHAATTGQTTDDHHAQSHTVASHSDTTATGAELNTLVGGGATALHSHAVAHAATTGQTTDDHHAQSHTVASHSDTTATGAELNTLTDGSNADALHEHAHAATTGQTTDDHHAQSHTVASHSDTTGTGAQLNTLVGGGNADALHTHAHSATTGQTTDDHHAQSHTVASHSDTTATGAELNTLVGGGATALHSHAVAHADTTGQTTDDHHAQSHTVASHSDTTGTGAELNTLTDGSNADTLHEHGNITVDSSPDVDDTGEGVYSSLTAGENIDFPQVCYMNADGEIYLADADDVAKTPVICMALEAKGDGQACSVLMLGFVRDDGWNWTIGGEIFLDEAAGDMSQTAPSDDGDQVQVLGMAITADIIWFNPQLVVVEHA